MDRGTFHELLIETGLSAKESHRGNGGWCAFATRQWSLDDMPKSGGKTRSKSASGTSFDVNLPTLTLPNMLLEQPTRIANQAATLTCMASGQDSDDLQAELFDPGLDHVFLCMSTLKADGKDLDVGTITSGLRVMAKWECENLGECVATLISYPANAGIDYYAAELNRQRLTTQRKAGLAKLINSVENISEEDFDAAIEELKNQSSHNPGPVTFAELEKEHPKLDHPVLHGLLREGECGNIIAATKVGKSWLANDLSLSVVTGQYPWFGIIQTVPGPVLHIDNELRPSTIVDRFNKVAKARGLQPEDWKPHLMIESLRGRWRSIYEIAAKYRQGDVKLIVVDALYRMLPAGISENDNAAITQVYNAIDSLAQRLKCAVVCVHHSSKGSQADKAVTDVGSGAGSQSRAVDCHMVIRPHEEDGCCVFEAAVRSFEPMKPIAMRFEFPLWHVDDSLDPLALKRPKTRGETKQDQKDREGIEDIRKAFERHDGIEMSRYEIRQQIGAGADRTNKLINRMLEDEDLVKVGSKETRNGKSTDIFRLNSLKQRSDCPDCS